MIAKLSFFVVAVLLVSCNPEGSRLDFAEMKADKFIENYSVEFLGDSELLRYNYHPRAQLTYGQDSTNIYRVFPREDEIRLICFTDTCVLSAPISNDLLFLRKGSYTIKQDSIFSNDSLRVQLHAFKFFPEEYFTGLKKRIEQYGIFAYAEAKDKSWLRVYLTTEYYLIHTAEVQEEIGNDQIMKTYLDNWYLVKMKKPLDLG